MSTNQVVVFFDGVCGLCNGFVDFIIKHDKKQLFKFSPLQSDFAKSSLPDQDGQLYSKSSAVLQVFSIMGGFWRLLYVFRIFPTSFNDFFYDIIASNRYNLFGKKETCRIPTPEERARFIL
jgi:predicted DCC family thiol-disulfide oxidoreductase YuxK